MRSRIYFTKMHYGASDNFNSGIVASVVHLSCYIINHRILYGYITRFICSAIKFYAFVVETGHVIDMKYIGICFFNGNISGAL